ncbi:hypothetical protein Tco_1027924, partial [Tanacetum coccineum]
IEVHIGRLKLLNEFYVIDMKKDPETPLLLGRGFLATANAVTDSRKAKITIGEGITSSDGVGARTPYYARKDFFDCHLPREWEIARDAEINPFKDVLVFRRMVKFLGAIPINLNRNMLIDLDGEEFTKTFQSVSTSRKLSKREDPREIIYLDHFYDTYLIRRSLEVLWKFHWIILGGRFNQLSHVSSPLLSKPGSQEKKNKDIDVEFCRVCISCPSLWLSNQTSVFLALRCHLEEIHVTWAHLEKKRTRLRLYTIYLEELCIQSVETASQASSDAVASPS